MKEITTNAGSLVLREGGKPTETINIGLQATTTAGENVVVTGNGKRWLLPVGETTFNGTQYETADSLAYDISNAGATNQGTFGVQSISGNIVDNSDPANPVVDFEPHMMIGVTVRSSDPIVLGDAGSYTYEGTGEITSVLPPAADSEGIRYFVFNFEGEGSWTVQGDIYESGMSVPSLTMMPGESYTLLSNGVKWIIT